MNKKQILYLSYDGMTDPLEKSKVLFRFIKYKEKKLIN